MSNERDWQPLLPGARVQCQRLGELVDLSRCLECNWLLDLDRAAGTPALRCAAANPVVDGRQPDGAIRHVD